MTDHLYDIAVAGAGAAGLLCAARLLEQDPKLKVIVLEKESGVGGRLRSTSSASRIWNYGLNQVSSKLYSFWDQTLKNNPDAPDLGEMSLNEVRTCGIISSNQIQTIAQGELFSKKGARAIAGAAAARDWANLEALKEALDSGKRKEQAFQTAWSGTQKSPSAIALEHIAASFGVADIWSSSTDILFAKGAKALERAYLGDWEQAMAPLVEVLNNREGSELLLDAEIIGAAFVEADHNWTLTTRKGQVVAKRLVVAMTPWDALRWLPKNYWPTELLQMTIKCKPISAVVLSETISHLPEHAELPDRLLVPAEGVQILISPNKDICYQATIDFEVSMQAPDVVKAVRRLRRARKKLLQAVEGLETAGDHLALVPVGWAVPSGHTDRRYVEKMNRSAINTEVLLFCGDAYGAHLDEDDNFTESLLAVCERLTNPAYVETKPAHVAEVEQDDSADY
jgi:glycine/D-amino acid oxidase-like deaminating enzyme